MVVELVRCAVFDGDFVLRGRGLWYNGDVTVNRFCI